MTMKIKFSKMHGLGNDFMVIDGINQSVSLSEALIAQWADRNFGIGFDQLLLVERPQANNALFKYRIFNADGTEVSQCGNGARCFARFVREQGLTDATTIPVETHNGLLQLNVIDDDQVQVNMGIPRFEPDEIPLNRAQREPQYQLDLDQIRVSVSALSIGNPHAVILVEDIESASVETIGPALESHPDFPERVNVGFMQILNRDHFKLRVYERGSGETLACGSGACAAMAAGHMLGLLDKKATASLRGGDLLLEWQGEGEPVMMTGSTAMVYQGELTV
jgi:diaminopimelate epimerase